MPSYDYNGIVDRIQSLRSQAYGDPPPSPTFPTRYFTTGDNESSSRGSIPKMICVDSLTRALEEFAEFASLCPMTPLLWLQYAFDAGNAILDLTGGSTDDYQVRLNILESALDQFPGCDLLWATYVRVSMDSFYCNLSASNNNNNNNNNNKTRKQIQSIIDRAIHWVGQGTHSYSYHVVHIWNMYAHFVNNTNNNQEARHRAVAQVFAQRSRTPLQHNDTLLQEAQHQYNYILNVAVNGYATLQDAIDKGKQYSSKIYRRRYESYELSLRSQMHTDGLLLTEEDDEDERIMTSSTLYMGNGGYTLASIFINYAKDLKQRRNNNNNNNNNNNHKEDQDTSFQMFERGISICPTVEHIWIAYIYSVQRLLAEDVVAASGVVHHNTAGNLVSLVNRAVRNCPYSLKLYTLKMHLLATTTTSDSTNELDVDAIIRIAKDACEGGFLPDIQHCLSIWFEACRVTRRALMSAVQGTSSSSLNYDDATEESKVVDDGEMLPYCDSDEIGYLIEDLRECFDEADTYFRLQGCQMELLAKIWRERANVECNIVLPIILADVELLSKKLHLASSSSSDDGLLLEGERCFEHIFQLSPLSMEAWSEYISFITTSDIIKQCGTFLGIRKARALLHRILPNASPNSASLELLCRFMVSFEEMYGSVDSLQKANNFVKDKLQKVQAYSKETNAAATNEQYKDVSRNKRKHGDIVEEEGDVKRHKGNATEGTTSIKAPPKPINLKVSKELVETILIGNLSYPVHPFTVKVSNLAPTTEDLELVDVFSKCGKLVHARILRDKSTHISKGTGFVQFEERESVAKALELNDTVGLHERLIQVGRSHIPAVSSVVPPPEKKRSRHAVKTDQQQQEQQKSKREANQEPNMEVEKIQEKNDLSSSLSSILSFHPRGVSRHGAKKKIQIET